MIGRLAYGVAERGYPLYNGLSMTLSSRLQLGTNVFTKDWDVCVVLDTCRYDALQAVAPEFEFVEEVGSLWSVGSATSEWMANTFVESYSEELSETVYVSQNSHSTTVLENREFPEQEKQSIGAWTKWNTVRPDAFLHLDEPWKWTSDEVRTRQSMEAVTDRAISLYTDYEPGRLLVHYLPPHHPYRADALEEERELEAHERDPFTYLRKGGSVETVWRSYLQDLRMGLEEVEILLSSIDAEDVVITADHGDGFGELGVLYSHPNGVFHPAVRRVPWVETSARKRCEHEPRTEMPAETLDSDPTEQLRNLGYL